MQSKYEPKYLIHLYEVYKSLPKPLWVPAGKKGKLQTHNVLLHSVVNLVIVIVGGAAKCLKGEGGFRGKTYLLPCGKKKKQRALSAVICLQGSR